MNIFKNHRRQRKGALVLEVALTAPIFFMVVFASVEFSRVCTVQNAIENAAFEGARRGIVPGATIAACQEKSQELIDIIGLKDSTVTIEPSVFTPSTLDITVTIAVPLNAENGFGISGFLKDRTLSQSVTLPVAWED